MNVTWHLNINGVSASVEAEPVMHFRGWADGRGYIEIGKSVRLYAQVENPTILLMEDLNIQLAEWVEEYAHAKKISVHLTHTPVCTKAVLKAKTTLCTVERLLPRPR